MDGNGTVQGQRLVVHAGHLLLRLPQLVQPAARRQRRLDGQGRAADRPAPRSNSAGDGDQQADRARHGSRRLPEPDQGRHRGRGAVHLRRRQPVPGDQYGRCRDLRQLPRRPAADRGLRVRSRRESQVAHRHRQAVQRGQPRRPGVCQRHGDRLEPGQRATASAPPGPRPRQPQPDRHLHPGRLRPDAADPGRVGAQVGDPAGGVQEHRRRQPAMPAPWCSPRPRAATAITSTLAVDLGHRRRRPRRSTCTAAAPDRWPPRCTAAASPAPA